MRRVYSVDLLSFFFFSSRRRHTRCGRDWSSDVCSSDLSHLGRPKNGAEEKFSLKHVVKSLESLIGTDVTFIDDCISDKAFEITKNLSSGKVVLLENLRFYSEE